MPLRTIIYARVSTEDQVEHYGLPAQLRACRDFAAAQGLEPVEQISDEGISGTILSRPGLDRVRALVREGACDVVLMLDVDRLSRELVHLLILKPEIEKRARLEFVVSKFEDSPSGRMFFGIRSVIAQYEREVIRERCTRGRWERARVGLIHGGRVPYGYRREGDTLAPDEPRASIARDIFAWFDSGLSMRAIVLRLRSNGTPCFTGRHWGHSSISRILGNETYAGVAHFGTHTNDAHGKTILRMPENRIALAVPALIDRACWERVQARRQDAKAQAGRPSPNYLLRGLLHCAACGRRMNAESGRARAYRCSGRDRMRISGERCGATGHAAKIDAAVWAEVVKVFTDAETLGSLLRDREQELRDVDPTRLVHLEAEAARLKRKEQTALSMMLDPDLLQDRANIKSQYREAQGQRMKVDAEIATLRHAAGANASAAEWIERTVALLQRYIPTLASAEQRQQFVRGIVSHAEWNGREVRMRCLIGPKSDTSLAGCVQFEPREVVLIARLAA